MFYLHTFMFFCGGEREGEENKKNSFTGTMIMIGM